MCSSREAQNIIKNPLGFETKDDFNIKILKKGDLLQRNRNILQTLAFMQTFDEISQWVMINSCGLKFIANPANASDTDRLCCLFAVQEPLVRALQPIEKRRKNGRDRRLLEAAYIEDYAVIANILASSAWTYWQNHDFQIEANGRIHISAAYEIINNESNLKKQDFQKVQINHIGAAIDFKKVSKKNALQMVLDFFETDAILEDLELEVE